MKRVFKYTFILVLVAVLLSPIYANGKKDVSGSSALTEGAAPVPHGDLSNQAKMEKKIERLVVGPIKANCWLYALRGEYIDGKQACAVIDPGDEAELIISRLKALDWVPKFILITHGHFDHVTALPDLVKAYPDAEAGIHQLDVDYLKEKTPLVYFEEGDTKGPLKIIHLPGHTPGSLCFFDEEAEVLFTGDTLFSGSWGLTNLPGGNEADMYKSLKRLLSMKGDIIVYPGHGPLTTIKGEAGLISSFAY